MTEEEIPVKKLSGHLMILLRFFLPFILGIAYVGGLYISMPYGEFLTLAGLMFVYFVPPAGKESVIPLGIAMGIPWWLIAFSVALMDILSSFFMVLNFDLALKIPVLGDRYMKSFMEAGEGFFEKHRYIERLSTIGLAIFVMIPMQGTGGVSTPIVGRMIGIPPVKVMIAVITGSLLGCTIIALGTEYIKDIFATDFTTGILVIVGIVLAAVAGFLIYRKHDAKLRSKKPHHHHQQTSDSGQEK
ncbi:small multi-drug export protein [Methanoplanus endosymbiosus]|uniref:Small multi-drug export protein n=1 Tax=Methanoplanus endosymbiosus TaxID=33865 RepID=A0A9E7TLI0_9EURY|nr:small multi-drug export protein [Methanoplanus endosymbiosus]UUX93780.1 small multi-drug export protein [Methanoplanus endosymbiosus]